MPQKPVGTRILPTAEWFAGNAAMAGGLARAPDSVGIQVSLFNDAPAGQYLWIWSVAIGNDAEGPYRVAAFEGAQGTFLQQGQYVMAGRGNAFGQVLYAQVPIANGDFPASPSQYPGLGYFMNLAGTQDVFTFPGPFSVLPPGFSLAVLNEWGGTPLGGSTLSCAFYYSILPYVPDKTP